MQLSITAIICIIGIFQGLLLAFTLVFSKDGRKMSNRLLAAVLVLTTIVLAHVVLEERDAFFSYPYLFFVKAHVFFLLGPLFFFYVKSHINKEFKFAAKDLLHLIPFLIFFLVVLPLYLESKATFQEMIIQRANQSKILSTEDMVVQGILKSYYLFYLIISLTTIRKFFKSSSESNVVLHANKFEWIKRIILITIFIACISMITDFLQPSQFTKSFVPIANVALIVLMGYLGLKQTDIYSVLELKRPQRKYKKSALTEEVSTGIFDSLMLKMKSEKLFKESDLSLPVLSKSIDTPPHHVSQVINEKFGMNYFNFISKYRIEEAKILISANNDMNFSQIAYEIGFNSISTFNAAFKKFTGYSPAEFKKQQ